MEVWNLVLFVSEAVLYFALMTTLLHLRTYIGLGVFLTALGVMHFVETYLAAVFYVALPFGIVSPGSSIFFAGKLMMILMLYMKEDASTVRQPIYGLFLGNLVTLAIAQLLLLHYSVEPTANQRADFTFLQDMGALMLWGTTLLYLDSVGIILLYERLGRWLPRRTVLRFAICGAVVLIFDQIGFFVMLNLLYGAPADVFWGGLKAKMVAVLIYTALFALYQFYLSEGRMGGRQRKVRDVFHDLTFRERYEDLLARTGRDGLTGLLDRSRMEIDAPRLLALALSQDKPASIVIIDIDHFKQINDRFGHLVGDELLKEIAETMTKAVRPQDFVFRYGGEEFVLLLPDLAHQDAMRIAARLRERVASDIRNPDGEPVTISLGVASAPIDGTSLHAVLSVADVRLYRAKSDGRNRVIGRQMA
ncbi:GGDEF domain-containing protein [Rhizobium sp. SL42]|uniref:GGDEF domain-containing protein n=1 Tax=Rhizobium sp. SL42 TaxID=2806346 RepID=UPI001F27783F|nr:GGDEF domain-containing protein [Rhizobium sp. SL42]UJW73471.1 GGDEF domain-containing protein [Rhizobium sp. SL42]